MGGVKHDYILDGTKILREGWNYDEETKTYQDILIPLYDNEDSVCGIIYNNVPYYFQKNLQGDVIGITNEHGTVVGAYRYDAWGAAAGIITCTELTDGVDIANINPFRYRSYYFDKEIEMYYLQSRYYDPQIARFVNGDRSDLVNFAGKNLFTYCFNIPVTYVDYNGNIPQVFVIVAAVIAASFINSLLLSIAMYAYAATGARFSSNIDISAWWNPLGSLMKGRLEDSRLIQERINSYIGKISQSSYSHKEHINFAERKRYSMDRDLWLSVGNASDCTITVTKTGKKRWFSKRQTYRVVIELSDDYDYAKFKREEQGLVLTAINNGLGYYPMSWGILKAYHWKIRHEFNYYYW